LWSIFDKSKIRLAGISNYFMVNADGGTGGGLFRKMYGEFLVEASELCKNAAMSSCGNEFIEIANKWEEIANLFMELHKKADNSTLRQISDIAIEIFNQENKSFNDLQDAI
jgi:hypothetical protein